MKTKVCTKCKGDPKPISEFPWNKKKTRPLARCYDCRNKEYRGDENAKARARNRNLLKQYGITLKDYNSLILKQKGKCLICGIPQEDLKQGLHVDHDHKTGEIRGLLCGSCNGGLGLFKDNIILLRKAIKYIKNSKININQ